MSKRLIRVLLMGILVTACSNSSVKVLNEASAKGLIERALQSKSDPSTAEMQAVGKVEIGEVTNLQLVTETRAAANFAWQSSQDRGAGVVEFVKKPDGTWVLVVAKAHDVGLVARQETFAIGSLRAINNGQSAFAASCGNGLYSPTLTNLGTPPTGGGTAFIGPDLGGSATITKSGYVVTMASSTGAVAGPASCNGLAAGAAVVGYFATATPIDGVARSFGTNTTGTIYGMPSNGNPMVITDVETRSSGARPIQ